jgi:hypothetical protein
VAFCGRGNAERQHDGCGRKNIFRTQFPEIETGDLSSYCHESGRHHKPYMDNVFSQVKRYIEEYLDGY